MGCFGHLFLRHLLEIKIFHMSRRLDIESEPSVFSSYLKTISYGADFSV